MVVSSPGVPAPEAPPILFAAAALSPSLFLTPIAKITVSQVTRDYSAAETFVDDNK